MAIPYNNWYKPNTDRDSVNFGKTSNILSPESVKKTRKSIDNIFNDVECDAGLAYYDVLFRKTKLTLMAVEPQIDFLRTVISESLDAYDLLDDAMRFGTNIGRTTIGGGSQSKLKNNLSCLEQVMKDGNLRSIFAPSNMVRNGINSIFSLTNNFEKSIKGTISSLITDIAESWLMGPDMVVFPILDSIGMLISKTGINKNITTLGKLKQCLISKCKVPRSHFVKDRIFYINGSSKIPVDSKGRVNVSKLWIFDPKGEGLNTNKNKKILVVIQKRYNKYNKQKGKLIGKLPTLLEGLGALFDLNMLSDCALTNNKLVDMANTLVDDVLDGLGTAGKNVLDSLNSGTGSISEAFGKIGGVSDVLTSPMKTIKSVYGNLTEDVTGKYLQDEESFSGKSNNKMKSSSQMKAEKEAEEASKDRGILGTVSDTITGGINSVSNGIKSITNEVCDPIRKTSNNLAEKLR